MVASLRYGRSMEGSAAGRIRNARGWIVLGVIVLTPIAVWATARPLDSRFAGTTATLGSLANITGLAAVAAFAGNLIIAGRLKPVARLFGGLEAMYAAHRRIAVAALALVVAHAVLAAGHADGLRLFLPAAGWAVFAGTIALACMAAALTLTFFVPLSHERFVLVQRALGVTFAIAALHAVGVPGLRSATPLLVVVAVLTAVALAAFVYRSLLTTVLARRHRYVVAAVNALDDTVVEIRLEPVGRGIAFMPGQFIFVSFRSAAVSREPHPYSIASAPGNGTLAVVVKALGDHTAALKGLTPGARADIEGPYGTFSYLNVPNVRQIWIAGGIGVTPLLSMARNLDGSDRRDRLLLLHGGARARPLHRRALREGGPVPTVPRRADPQSLPGAHQRAGHHRRQPPDRARRRDPDLRAACDECEPRDAVHRARHPAQPGLLRGLLVPGIAGGAAAGGQRRPRRPVAAHAVHAAAGRRRRGADVEAGSGVEYGTGRATGRVKSCAGPARRR